MGKGIGEIVCLESMVEMAGRDYEDIDWVWMPRYTVMVSRILSQFGTEVEETVVGVFRAETRV